MRQLFIDGEWVDSTGSDGIDGESPVDGEIIDTVPAGTTEDVRRAVEAAEAARWELREMTAFERAQILDEVTEYFVEHEDEIAEGITREEGKALHESYEETEYVVESSEDYGHDAIRQFGDVVPSEWRGRHASTQHEPYGPVRSSRRGTSRWRCPAAASTRPSRPPTRSSSSPPRRRR